MSALAIPPDERSSEPGRGPWFLSLKGRRIYPFSLRPEEVDIEEVALSLSLTCRFNGHCRAFYSVAQHSVLVALQLPPDLRLVGLLHDATEAYVGDLIRPIKRALPEFSRLEGQIWESVAARFGLPANLPTEVKMADNRMLQTERRDLLAVHPWAWTIDQAMDGAARPYPDVIEPWTASRGCLEFLDLFSRLIYARSPEASCG